MYIKNTIAEYGITSSLGPRFSLIFEGGCLRSSRWGSLAFEGWRPKLVGGTGDTPPGIF